MKFSPDINHKSVVNWWKNFGRSTTDMSATPLFVSKLRKDLAAILFEIFSKKFFWLGSRPISVTQWQEFQISPKKWRFAIFRTSAVSRGNRVIYGLFYEFQFSFNLFFGKKYFFWTMPNHLNEFFPGKKYFHEESSTQVLWWLKDVLIFQ